MGLSSLCFVIVLRFRTPGHPSPVSSTALMVAWRYLAVNCFSSGVQFNGGTPAFAAARQVAATYTFTLDLEPVSSKSPDSLSFNPSDIELERQWRRIGSNRACCQNLPNPVRKFQGHRFTVGKNARVVVEFRQGENVLQNPGNR